MIIGITGEIGSGKTTISKILTGSFRYISADNVGRLVVESGKPAYLKIVDYFGEDVLNPDKTINRVKLGDIVFSDNDKLRKLNEITHKYIYEEIRRMTESYKEEAPEQSIIIDAALLYEIGLDKLCDQVWFIEANRNMRLERIMLRNGFSKEDALKRINSQDFSRNKLNADRIIYNNDDFENVKKQVLEIINCG